MTDTELRELRRSNRIELGEGQKIKTRILKEEEVSLERIQIECSVVGCKFKTEYLGPAMAKEQNDIHWRAKHKAKFEQEELDRQLDLEEQLEKARKNRKKENEREENELIVRKLMEQEMIRKAKNGLGKLTVNRDGKLDLVELSTEEKQEFEDSKQGASGVETGQVNEMLGLFSEKLKEVVTSNDEKIARTLEAVSEQSKHLEILLEQRNSNNGGGNNGRNVLVKEPPLPKLGPGQKYDEWIKQAEGWLEEMEKCWNGRDGLGKYAVRINMEHIKKI